MRIVGASHGRIDRWPIRGRGESYSDVIIRGARSANQSAACRGVGLNVGPSLGENCMSLKLLQKSHLIGAQGRNRTTDTVIFSTRRQLEPSKLLRRGT
jgi:hypothetical protein